MKKTRLVNRLMRTFAIIMVAMIGLVMPLFYLIVTNFYAEDLITIAKVAHIAPEQLDLERDTVVGVVMQLLLVVSVLIAAIVWVVRVVSVKQWRPFEDTLRKIRQFKVEKGIIPTFHPTAIREFDQLNTVLENILSQSVKSYNGQKQFTENASHELQTPLAIMQSKLDLLFQSPDLKQEQVALMQDLYHEVNRMSKLNRSLLLLSKIENAQYQITSKVNISQKLEQLLPSLEVLANGIQVETQIENPDLEVSCNEILLESMMANLIINAIRHNRSKGTIVMTVGKDGLEIKNLSDEPALDPQHLFDRFYQRSVHQKGNGLGLAIVKSICDYHGWQVSYQYKDGWHQFSVGFAAPAALLNGDGVKD